MFVILRSVAFWYNAGICSDKIFEKPWPQFSKIENVRISLRDHLQPSSPSTHNGVITPENTLKMWRLKTVVRAVPFSQLQNTIFLSWYISTWKNVKAKIAGNCEICDQAKITRMLTLSSQHHKCSNFNKNSLQVSQPPVFSWPMTL